ncbi:MAG: zeta toxin family protein [Christensenella sp.]|nr:zeta toxin family protein [Christensenella sp.]
MKIYTVIGGVNGAGKSSLTGVLKTERSDLGKIIDVDKLAVQYGSFIEGGKAAIQTQESYIREGISFTQETTLSGQRPLRMIREAKEAGYYVRLFYVGISSAQEALKRIENRVSKGGHDIPREDVLRSFDERNEALAKVLDYVDEAVLYDNENGFVAIAEYKNGELISRGDYVPDWLKDLQRYLKHK